MRRTGIAGVLLLALTLGAGFGLGVFYARHHAVVRVLPAIDLRHFMRRLESQLELDSAQSAQIQRILTRRQVVIDSIWGALRPTVRGALDTTLIEMIAVLREDQRVKLRGMVAELHPGVVDHLR